VTSTNLQTEFLLQFQKQWEDSGILLASNRPKQQWQDKETKNDRKGKEKQKERTNRERLWTSGLTRTSPLTRPEAKSFWKTKEQNKKKQKQKKYTNMGGEITY
jgi:hypothetical protein